jgi:hypothetical protein
MWNFGNHFSCDVASAKKGHVIDGKIQVSELLCSVNIISTQTQHSPVAYTIKGDRMYSDNKFSEGHLLATS